MSVSRKEVRLKKKASGKAKFYRVVAALLIVAGLGVLGFAGFQRVMVNYRQAQLRDDFEATAGFRHLGEEPPVTVTITEWQPMRLIIPAIEVNLVAVGGGDVFDRKLLDQGPTHFQMSDLPSTEGGNVAFAGHRAGRWNFFLNIDKLNEGDEIYLDVGGYRFIYLVEWVRVFDKYDWTPIDSTEYPAITLQTCEPPHVSNPDWRLMARGALDKVIIAPVEAPEAN
jgi:LPXTG-site transpeptidase (sortase) family protein